MWRGIKCKSKWKDFFLKVKVKVNVKESCCKVVSCGWRAEREASGWLIGTDVSPTTWMPTNKKTRNSSKPRLMFATCSQSLSWKDHKVHTHVLRKLCVCEACLPVNYILYYYIKYILTWVSMGTIYYCELDIHHVYMPITLTFKM